MKKKSFFILAAALVTVAAMGFYGTVQQTLRRATNEPQASMANDVASSLENGARPQDLTKGQVNMANNMAPFIIIYDKDGKVVSGNGYLDGQVPQVPIGVLRASTREKSNRITWQPEDNVRVASVTYATRDYYVLGGRSTKVSEDEIIKVARWTGLVWLVAVALLAGAYTVTVRKEKRSAKTKAS